MSRKHFSILAVATLLAVLAIALLIPGKVAKEPLSDDAKVLPGLAAWVNDADRLTVTGAGNTTVATLVREQTGWVVEELSGYSADWGRIRGLLSDLSQAVVVESKTDNPDYYDRLGVQDIHVESATGKLLTVSAGEQVARLLVGKLPQGRDGQFVRLPDAPGSLLVDRELVIPEETVDWAAREVLEIASADVADVTIEHADGEVIRIQKISADDTDFTLLEMPEGRELQSSWSVNSIADAFSSLQLDDVKPAAELDWAESVQIHVITFSGWVYDLQLASGEDDHWLQWSAKPHGDAESDQPVPEPLAELIERTSGWAFQIPAYKAEAMNKRFESLLKPVETE